MTSLRRLLSALVGKQKSLADGRRMRTAASVDFQASDTAKFWLLHTVNSYIPIVSHLVDHGVAHPEEVYMILGNMIGELCTFDADGDPTTIPKFNYLELTDVFEPMIERAIRQITGVMAESYIIVPLEKREDGMYLGKFEDPKLPRTHELFLEAKGADEGILRERLPRLLKIGSWTQIGYILNAAMPGVRVGGRVPPPGRHPGEARPGLPPGRSGRRLLERYPRLWHHCHLSAHRSAEGRPPADRRPGFQVSVSSWGRPRASPTEFLRTIRSSAVSDGAGPARLRARACAGGEGAHEPLATDVLGLLRRPVARSCSSAARATCRRRTSSSAACSGCSTR